MTTRTVITLTGSSGAGKTYASLLMQRLYGWKAIVSYTTRRRRDGETNGIKHWFVKENNMPPRNRMCAYTFFGGHHYWTTWEQVLENIFPCIYVIDEKGLLELKDKIASMPINLVTVKVKRENRNGINDKRIERDNGRIALPDSDYDFIVENNGTLEEFDEKIMTLCNQINDKLYGSK